ncbi:flotillin family protein [Arthrobacter burdickii]|uniref:SPFH domain-containing protein n=1 Tax=Arthrobacter burdickii TaxID=3035920 RepID=A0ABT8JZ11_9MICC|nr:flotillin family protein [Arthrobacter burdickii]MDN4610406.1 SPFH domain-containing protein [Arthrobacter burdickii]
MDLTFIPLIIGAVVLLAIIIAAVVLARMALHIASPDQALIISSKDSKGQPDPDSQRVVFGRIFINPFSQRAYPLSLASRQVSLRIEGISKNGIKLHLTGVAQVKVGGDADAVRKAAQRFLNQQEAIDHYTQETLSGSLRSIVGTLTVESIIRDRATFAKSVKEEAEHSMHNQGLEIDTFQIQSVDDDSGYLKNLGRPEAALAERNAKIAEARSMQESEQARALSDEQVALAQQQLIIRRAELKEEADARQARADAAGPLAQAEQQEQVIIREQQVAQRRAELRERELDTEVRKPADAEKYRLIQQADAKLEERRRASEAAEIEARVDLARRKLVAEGDRVAAEADAAANTARGTAEASINEARGRADAAVIASRGNAEAGSAEARGKAEAAGIAAQAEAYEKFNQAAILSKVLEVLPAMAREIASPMSAIDTMTVVSNDGASQLSRNVSTGVHQTTQLVKDTTGLDIIALLGDLLRTPDKAGMNGSTRNGTGGSTVTGSD